NQSRAYDNLKNYQESNAFLKKHFFLNDSLLSIEKTIVLEDAQTKYEVNRIQSEKELAKKEAIIAQQESQEHRNYLIGSILISFLLLISFFSFIQRSKTKKKAQLIALELSETKKRLEIEKL